MSYGLLVFNDDGNIIIDDQYYNLRQSASGTAQVGNSYPPSSVSNTAGYLPTTGQSIFARPIRVAETELDVMWTAIDLSTSLGFRWGASDPNGYGDINKMPSSGYQYYVFSDSDLTTGNYGLEVYDENTKLCFSSNMNSNIELVFVGDVIETGGVGFGTLTYNIPVGQNINDYVVFTNNLSYNNFGDIIGTGFDTHGYNKARFDYSNNKIVFTFYQDGPALVGKYVS